MHGLALLEALVSPMGLTYFSQNNPLSYDAEHERVLTVRELSWAVWTLPPPILLHEVHMVQCTVIKFRVVKQRWLAAIVSRV